MSKDIKFLVYLALFQLFIDGLLEISDKPMWAAIDIIISVFTAVFVYFDPKPN